MSALFIGEDFFGASNFLVVGNSSGAEDSFWGEGNPVLNAVL
jgi:hypothetical protein